MSADTAEYEIIYPDTAAQNGGAIATEVGEVEAFLFDCDGTLVDSMPMWTENWRHTSAMFGLEGSFHEGFLYEHAGKTIEETLKILCAAEGKEVDYKEFFEAKEKHMADIYPLVKEIPPVAAIARAAEGRMRMAVVSSGPRYMVEALLKQSRLDHLFEFMVCAEDVTKHKPDPEPYLAAAGRLGVIPHRCRVFEDADAGMASGSAAGMQTVDVRKMEGYPRA